MFLNIIERNKEESKTKTSKNKSSLEDNIIYKYVIIKVKNICCIIHPFVEGL
jgi:hypothetical protein